MSVVLLLAFLSTCYIAYGFMEQGPSKYDFGNDKHSILNTYYNSVMNNLLVNAIPQNNLTYIDKAENMLRIPSLNKFHEQYKPKKKTAKKAPRSTIQKIIKNNKVRTKKLYFVSTKATTLPKTEYDSNIDNPEETQFKDESSTTKQNLKKKLKRDHKYARYPMPFHKMQNRKDYEIRSKRSEERKDVFLLKDFDEIEFVGKEDGADIVKTHTKKYWEID